MTWYRAGTVSVTNGSPSVTGSGTAFVANVSIGEGIVLPDGRIYEVTNVASDTSLTMNPAYLGSTASSQSYAIAPLRGRIAQLLSETSSLIASFADVRDGIGSGLFPNGTVSAPALRASADQDTGLFFPSANTLGFVTGGVSRFTVSSAGISNGLGAVATPSYTFTGDTNTGMWSPAADTLAFSEGGVEAMRITSAGNVGIGTTAPNVRLHVEGQVRSSVGYIISGAGELKTSLAGSGIAVNGGGANGISFETGGGGGTERMRITSAGNVGIGTSSPADRLSVNSAAGSGAVGSFTNTSSGSSLGGIVASIESGGNNTNSFHFAGVTQTVALWYLYGNGTTSYTSDIRVKKNVETARDGYLEDVSKLRVVKFNWYNDTDDTPRELGFIAQEVEQVFPGLVQDALHPTKDGVCHKVLKASVLVPILTKALQEANSKIDALEARMTALEASASTITFQGN